MLVADGIVFIQRGWANANMCVLRGASLSTGQPDTWVIDPGHFSYIHQTIQLLAKHNVSPQSIDAVAVTHSHWDHACGVNALQAYGTFDVFLPELTNRWMRERALREMWLSYFGVEANIDFCAADKVVIAGSQLEMGGRIWDAIALPGHAPDTIGYFQAEEGVLISADAIMANGDCGLINTKVHGDAAFDAALASVDRIASLNPRIILPGHGPVITDVSACISKLRRKLERFKTSPLRHVSHLARRVVMASVLEIDPQTPSQLVDTIAEAQWAKDYAPMIAQTPRELVQTTLDVLLQGGALVSTDGVLVATVPL